MTPEEITQEAGFIRNEDEWPNWPVLPVKRRGHGDIGILVAPHLTTVILMNMWELTSGLLKPQVEDKEALTFESVEEMVAEGWVGD